MSLGRRGIEPYNTPALPHPGARLRGHKDVSRTLIERERFGRQLGGMIAAVLLWREEVGREEPGGRISARKERPEST